VVKLRCCCSNRAVLVLLQICSLRPLRGSFGPVLLLLRVILLTVAQSIEGVLGVAFAVAEQDVAADGWTIAYRNFRQSYLREKCFLHVGHSYGRSRVSARRVRHDSEGIEPHCWPTRSLVSLDVFELGELPVAQAALFQGHRGRRSEEQLRTGIRCRRCVCPGGAGSLKV
jgi:hypothetical protein